MVINLRKTTKQVNQSFVDDSSTNNTYIPKLVNITLWCLVNEDKQRFINPSILEDLKAKSLVDKLDHARATTCWTYRDWNTGTRYPLVRT